MINGLTTMDYSRLWRVAQWGYGWKQRKELGLSSLRHQWKDPMAGVWYGERVALRRLRIQLMDPYRER